MPGNCLAFAQELRKAGSFNDTYLSLFLRAASSVTESNKNFIKDIVFFILKKSGGRGVVFGLGFFWVWFYFSFRRCHL